MESGGIEDRQITSSSWDANYNPTFSRLNLPKGWAPAWGERDCAECWLQVDFQVWRAFKAWLMSPKSKLDIALILASVNETGLTI